MSSVKDFQGWDCVDLSFYDRFRPRLALPMAATARTHWASGFGLRGQNREPPKGWNYRHSEGRWGATEGATLRVERGRCVQPYAYRHRHYPWGLRAGPRPLDPLCPVRGCSEGLERESISPGRRTGSVLLLVSSLGNLSGHNHTISGAIPSCLCAWKVGTNRYPQVPDDVILRAIIPQSTLIHSLGRIQ